MEIRHKSVLVSEVINYLKVLPGGIYIDCTVGEGGHSEAILNAGKSDTRLLGIDLDTHALDTARVRLAKYGQKVVLNEGSFRNLREISDQNGFAKADGVLLDLGVSSLQLEMDDKGFSFLRPGRLDMRFGKSQEKTAHELVNNGSEGILAEIIYKYGEERRSRQIARAIVNARPIDTTVELAAVISSVPSRTVNRGIHPATRTFQGLRIAVNHELENLQMGLEQALEVLRPSGRLVVISYHSLEDRIVKNFLRTEGKACVCPTALPECSCDHVPSVQILTTRVMRPSSREINGNPRSRSARMRVAERI